MKIETYEDAQHEVRVRHEEYAEDLGVERDEIEVTDMVVAVAYEIEDDEIVRQLCRTEIGWVPMELQDRLG